MVPVVAMLALGRRDMTVGEAFAEATRALAAFGVAGAYRLHSGVSIKEGQGWFISLKVGVGDGHIYWVAVDPTSGCLDGLDREGKSVGARAPRAANAHPASEQAARVEESLKAFFGANLAMTPEAGEHGDENLFSAVRTAMGHAFLPEEGGSIVVELDARTGAPVLIRDLSPPLTYEFQKPRLDGRRAVSDAERFLRLRPPRRPTQWYVERTTTIGPEVARSNAPRDVVPQLGWHVVKNTLRTRLAWRVPFVARWRTAKDDHSWRVYGLSRIYLDAATGAVLDSPAFDADGMPDPSSESATSVVAPLRSELPDEKVSLVDHVEPGSAGIFVQGAGPPGRDQGASLTCLTCSAS